MEIRRLYTVVEETLHDMGELRDEPLRKVAVVAVIKNPHAGKGYVEDLSDLTEASIALGDRIATMGAVGTRPAKTICYEPSVALRCGMGCIYWEMDKETANV